MRRPLIWLLSGCLALLAWQSPVRAQPQQTRVAVVVGNNVGHDPGRALRYAEAEARRLADLLRTTGDFDSVVTVGGASRDGVESSLATAKRQLEAAHAAGRRTLFLFYYSGHGDQEALELGSSRLPLRDLRGYLEQLAAADVRVALVDACQSGALTGVKGGRRAPAYDIHLADPGTVRGMAIVTSSTANELSQESDDLGGSFFTHNIMAGLRGAADSSHDGQVTLSEIYQFAFRRTLASTAASLTGGQHPTYDYRMAGAGDVILSRTRPNDARLAFPRDGGATYTIMNRKSGEVIAELPTTAGEDIYLAVPAGDYRIVRRALASVSQSSVTLAAGSSTTIEASAMDPVSSDSESHRKKGFRWEPNTIGVHFGVQSAVVDGGGSLQGTAALSYARNFGWFSLRGRGEISSFDANSQQYESAFLRTSVAVDFLWNAFARDNVAFLIGPTVGMPITRQRDLWKQTNYSTGLAYGGIASLQAKIWGSTWVSISGGGGGEVYRLNGARVNRPSASASVGGLVGF